MKVILLKDIAKTGKKFDVVAVSDGFALNHLIPRGLAKVATKSSLGVIEQMKKAQGQHAKIQHELLMKNLKALSEKKITITAKANEKGHLFKGIHTDEICMALHAEHIELPSEYIKLEHPIKEVGTHEISVHSGEVKETFTLTIEADSSK